VPDSPYRANSTTRRAGTAPRSIPPPPSPAISDTRSRAFKASQLLWDTLYGLVTDGQRRLLDLSLEVPDGARTSRFDQLRKGPAAKPSGPQMVRPTDRRDQTQDSHGKPGNIGTETYAKTRTTAFV
jgi:hypothetical protein